MKEMKIYEKWQAPDRQGRVTKYRLFHFHTIFDRLNIISTATILDTGNSTTIISSI